LSTKESRGYVHTLATECSVQLFSMRSFMKRSRPTVVPGQAFCVVVLSAVAAGVGGLEHHGVSAIFNYTLTALASWWIWAYVAFLVGTKLLPGPETQADPGELLHTIGFSSAPGVLRILALISPIAGTVFLVCTMWMLVTMVVAVRQALDYSSTARAIAVCAIGFPIYAATLALSMLLLGPWPL
jgi:hypothetical protein